MRERTRLADAVGRVRKLEQERADALEFAEMAEAEGDEASLDDASAQLASLKELSARAELEALLSGEADGNDCFVEINSGAGGTESNDWAAMLLRMYTRWASAHGMTVEFIEETDGEQAGIKSATIVIKGPNAYGWLKTEAGVHRLVRISPFDSNARRHTSFASVWVYPVVDDKIEIEINPADVRTDTYRSVRCRRPALSTRPTSAVLPSSPTSPPASPWPARTSAHCCARTARKPGRCCAPGSRAGAATARGGGRGGGGGQDRHRLGPPDPLLRPAALSDGQGPQDRRGNLRHPGGAGRRP